MSHEIQGRGGVTLLEQSNPGKRPLMQFFLDTQNNTRDIGCNPIEDAAVAVLPDGPCSQNNGVQSFSNQTINFSIDIHPPLEEG